MVRLLRSLWRFYPKAWRERYGSEFEALLEDIHPRGTDLFDILRGGLTMRLTHLNLTGLVAIFAIAGGIAAVGTALAMPARWRSEAVVRLRSSDGQLHSKDGVAKLSQGIFSDAMLTNLITRSDLIRRNGPNGRCKA